MTLSLRCVGDGHGRSVDSVNLLGIVGMDRSIALFIDCSILMMSMSCWIYNRDLLSASPG
jgi:hypothetical protein